MFMFRDFCSSFRIVEGRVAWSGVLLVSVVPVLIAVTVWWFGLNEFTGILVLVTGMLAVCALTVWGMFWLRHNKRFDNGRQYPLSLPRFIDGTFATALWGVVVAGVALTGGVLHPLLAGQTWWHLIAAFWVAHLVTVGLLVLRRVRVLYFLTRED